jgi:hypothetical protein
MNCCYKILAYFHSLITFMAQCALSAFKSFFLTLIFDRNLAIEASICRCSSGRSVGDNTMYIILTLSSFELPNTKLSPLGVTPRITTGFSRFGSLQ